MAKAAASAIMAYGETWRISGGVSAKTRHLVMAWQYRKHHQHGISVMA